MRAQEKAPPMRDSSAASPMPALSAPSESEQPSRIESYISLVTIVAVASLLLPIVTVVCSHYDLGGRFGAAYMIRLATAAALVFALGRTIHRLLARHRAAIEALALAQGAALD